MSDWWVYFFGPGPTKYVTRFSTAQLSFIYKGYHRIIRVQSWSVLCSPLKNSVLWKVWFQCGCWAPQILPLILLLKSSSLCVAYGRQSYCGGHTVLPAWLHGMWQHSRWSEGLYFRLIGAALLLLTTSWFGPTTGWKAACICAKAQGCQEMIIKADHFWVSEEHHYETKYLHYLLQVFKFRCVSENLLHTAVV